jgi:hypothetical protein
VRYFYHVSYMVLTRDGFNVRTAELSTSAAITTMEDVEGLNNLVKKVDDTRGSRKDPVVLAFCLLRIEEKE